MTDDAPRENPLHRQNSWRSQYRSRSHESAHAETTPPPPAKYPDLPLIPHGAAQLIATPEALSQLLAHLRAAGSFAYDSEFIGELTYVPKLCLIQVASAQQVALIDPLADLDLMPFWQLLCDPAVEKIVHAGQQDVEPVIRHTGREPANVFDTQIAAGFIGMTYPVSLSKLVRELVGVKLGKGMTFSHWDQRPLSPMQLRYAADDVRYLPAVRAQLGARLAATHHADWAAEESASICDAALYRFDPETQYLRVRGATSLHPRGLAVLRELTHWRDTAARAHDVPPRAVLKDEILIDLARSPIDSVEKLSRVRGLPRPVEQANGAALVEAMRRAAALNETELPTPRHVEESPTEHFHADALWAATQCLCIGQSIDPALLTSRQEIGEFYRAVAAAVSVDDLRIMRGWRRQAVGQRLLDLLAGTTRITLDWSGDSLQATTSK